MWRRMRTYAALRRRGVPRDVLRSAGANFSCGPGAFFRPGEDIAIGANVFFGRNVHISAPCEIRDDVMLASFVALVGGDHRFDTPGVLMQASGTTAPRKIVVEEDVWIGHGSIILAGVRIGRGSIVAAGSVVAKDIPPCTIWASPPAVFLRDRFPSQNAKAEHLDALARRFGTR